MGQHLHKLLSKNESEKTGVCPTCGPVPIRLKGGTWRCANIIRIHSLRARRLPGIASLVLRKDGCCEICGRTQHLVVDHCEETKTIRGLLCSRCNTGIGKLLHDPKLLQSAIDYLSKKASG